MGIGASFTLLFVAGFFSAMFWLIGRTPAPRAGEHVEAPPSDSVVA